MHRISIVVSVVAVVLLGALVAGRASTTTAQDATLGGDLVATANHPIVGSWRWANDLQNPADVSYAVIEADGTYVEMYPRYGVGIGSWEVTGERSGSLTIVFQDVDPSPNGFAAGYITYRLAVEADQAGNALTATGTSYRQRPDGRVVEELPFEGAATRVEVAPSGPLTWPAAGTPTP